MNPLLFQLGSLLLLGAMGCGLYRSLRGPTILDRMLGLDLVIVCTLGITLLLGVMWESTVFLDWILVISLLGFLSTVALTLYLMRGGEGNGPE